jgi:hypothetical protein
MTASFTLRPCTYCGQTRPVLDDGRFTTHFLGNGDVCAGSALGQEEFDADPMRQTAIDYVMRVAAARLGPPGLH